MATYNVSDATQLSSALSRAVGGDTIVLAAGDYGSVRISGKNFSSNVTIKTADFDNPAHLDGLYITRTHNLTVSGLDVGRTLNPGEPDYTQLSSLSESTNIKFSRMNFHGSLDDNPHNDGLGLVLSNVTGFKISDSHFQELYRGLTIQRSANIAIESNTIEAMRSDGAVVVATDGIVFDGNHFSEFKPRAGDHADFIQFWNINQTRGSSNITIKNNVMMQDYFSGVVETGVQGIFLGTPESFGYKNILIQNNMMWSSDLWNGITVHKGENVQILGNTVISKANDPKQFWIRLDSGTNYRVEDNITDNIIVKNMTGLYQANNINFAVNPEARSLIPNINDPSSALDLMIPGAGFRPIDAPVPSPVSAAVGSGIGNLMFGTEGAYAGKTALPRTLSGSIDMRGLESAQVSAEPVGQALPSFGQVFGGSANDFASASLVSTPVFSKAWHIYDHFTALPDRRARPEKT